MRAVISTGPFLRSPNVRPHHPPPGDSKTSFLALWLCCGQIIIYLPSHLSPGKSYWPNTVTRTRVMYPPPPPPPPQTPIYCERDPRVGCVLRVASYTCILFAISCLLLRLLLVGACCLLPVACHLLFPAVHFPFHVCCLLPVVCYLLLVSCYLLKPGPLP